MKKPLLGLIISITAFGQSSFTLRVQNAGTTIKTASAYLMLNFTSGTSASVSGNTITISGPTLTGYVSGAGNLTTVGAIPYVSAGGTLNQDQTAGGEFFWDSVNHRLGIGTTLPGYALDVNGTVNTNLLRFNSSGGYISTYASLMNFFPSAASSFGLQFTTQGGTLDINPSDYSKGVRFYSGAGQGGLVFRTSTLVGGENGTNQYSLAVKAVSGQTANIQEWQNSGGTALTVIDNNGNVGIGTTNPGSKVTSTGDVFVTTSAAGVILTDSAAACWRIAVVPITGILSTATVSCPTF
jgi:hypothetical protein